MQQVNGVQVYNSDPSLLYEGLEKEPTWFSAQGGVYQCCERTSRRPIAIKKYLVEDNHHPDIFVMPQELVENEIYTMTKCNHTNILKLLSVHLHQEFVYLIMPLCAGGSLQQYVFEHHLNYGQLAHIVGSIAAGLEEIHRHGYIHRDIKCDNIFLDNQANQVVIGDFGVVSITPAADSSIEEAGVVLFWAPELVQGKMVNRKIDIWALGIVILEILNGGRAPYEDEKLDEEEIKQRILMNGKPAYPEGLPSRLVDLLDHCLNPDPRARASATDILHHPFVLDYEHEPLFHSLLSTSTPISGVIDADGHNYDDDGEQPSLASIDADIVDEDSMLNALKTLKDMKPIHELDLTLGSAVPALSETSDSLSSTQSQPTKATTSSLQLSLRRKCRLPIPSFVINEVHAASVPAKVRIANVRSNRQSLTEKHRKQGSRLPMLKIVLASPPPDLNGKKLRKARSVRLSSSSTSRPSSSTNLSSQRDHMPKSDVKKPLARSHTLPTRQYNNNNGNSSSKRPSSSTSKNSTDKKTFQPPADNSSSAKTKTAVTPTTQPLSYRQKRLPESRTARLMMGISTTGRRSAKSQQQSATLSTPLTPEVTKTTSKRLSSTITASVSTKKRPQDTKQRPVSFSGPKSTTSTAASSSSKHSRQHPALPPLPPSLSKHQRPRQQKDETLSPPTSPIKARRRLSAPAPKNEPSGPSTSSTGGSFGKANTFKGMKVLRAY